MLLLPTLAPSSTRHVHPQSIHVVCRYENRSFDGPSASVSIGDSSIDTAARITVGIARSWQLLFKFMKSGRAQVQVAASYISFLQGSDPEAFDRLLQHCKDAVAVAAIVKSIVSGGLKSDSLAEEVGIMLLMRTLSGISSEHAGQLFPRGGVAKIIKKIAANLKTGRAPGSSRGWSISLDLLNCFAAFSFAAEPLNKLVYIPAAKGSSASKKSSARILLELICSSRFRRRPLPPIPLQTLVIYCQVPHSIVAARLHRLTLPLFRQSAA